MLHQGHQRAVKAAKADKAVMAQSAAAKSGRENYQDGAPGYNSRSTILVDCGIMNVAVDTAMP